MQKVSHQPTDSIPGNREARKLNFITLWEVVIRRICCNYGMITYSLTNIDQARELFGGAVVDKAVKSTLNKLAEQAKTAVSKEIRKTYNIKARDLSAAMKVQRVRGGAYESHILTSGPRFSLMYFDAQQTLIRGNDAITTRLTRAGKVSKRTRKGRKQSGVTVRVKNNEGRKLVKGRNRFGAFMANTPGGSTQIFTREARSRLPIDKLTGPAVAQMLGQKTSVVQDFINRESGRIFSHELDFFAQQVVGRV
jgi:hypothetical protein